MMFKSPKTSNKPRDEGPKLNPKDCWKLLDDTIHKKVEKDTHQVMTSTGFKKKDVALTVLSVGMAIGTSTLFGVRPSEWKASGNALMRMVDGTDALICTIGALAALAALDSTHSFSDRPTVSGRSFSPTFFEMAAEKARLPLFLVAAANIAYGAIDLGTAKLPAGVVGMTAAIVFYVLGSSNGMLEKFKQKFIQAKEAIEAAFRPREPATIENK